MLCLGVLRTTEFVLLYLRREPAFHLSQLIQKPRVAVPQFLFTLLCFAAYSICSTFCSLDAPSTQGELKEFNKINHTACLVLTASIFSERSLTALADLSAATCCCSPQISLFRGRPNCYLAMLLPVPTIGQPNHCLYKNEKAGSTLWRVTLPYAHEQLTRPCDR